MVLLLVEVDNAALPLLLLPHNGTLTLQESLQVRSAEELP